MRTVDRIALAAMLSVAVIIPVTCGIAFGLEARVEQRLGVPPAVLHLFKAYRGAATSAAAARRD
jgi:hypothetical protein